MEWSNTFEYLPSSETQIGYFLGSDRQRSTGQFYTQVSHRGRSAYLRTIEIAKKFYDMPDTYAEHLSILALPIEPAYTGFKPRKPFWLPRWDRNSTADIEGITKFVKIALENFGLIDNSQELLTFSIPIKIDEHNWIDLSIVRAAIFKNSGKALQIEERSGCITVGALIDPELTYEFSNDDENHSGVMATTPYPLNRYGHWHSDMESRGLYVPKCDVEGKKLIGKTTDGEFRFCYYVDKSKIGFSSFWFSEWQPKHPKGVRSLCGSSTVIYKDKLGDWYTEKELVAGFVYVCKANVLSSEDSYRDFDEQELNFIVAPNI
ncbi:DNA circulation protein, putative [methanotrophic endosymbiont of Bathymodiolus azoricus (Menez Gwen)]|nr:DNA circulation protein, putative [methanotrophic endosymbiont of Bathymodiolus azoricus (Menez Gwen)]